MKVSGDGGGRRDRSGGKGSATSRELDKRSSLLEPSRFRESLENSPPSPVMATTAPLLCNASTIAILCFGVVLANTLTPPILSVNCL